MNLTPNESYYRKVNGSLGISLLLFWGLHLGLEAILLSLESALPHNSRISVVGYQTLSGLGHLFVFLLPCALLKILLTKSSYYYREMKLSVRFPVASLLAIPLGIAVIFSAAQINTAFTDLLGFDKLTEAFTATTIPNGDEPYELVLRFLVMCLIPGFCEELLFRGAILTNLLPFGRSNAILISSLLFALMHQNPQQIFSAFVAGIILGVLYEMAGSIWPCVLLHILNSFAAMSEDLIANAFADSFRGEIILVGLNLCILFLSGIGMLLLLVKFFGKRKDFHNGVFGKDVPASDQYALYPISAKLAKRLFWSPPMTVFMVICSIEVIALMGMAVLYGLLY